MMDSRLNKMAPGTTWSQQSEIQKSILATLAFFDLFDYPLVADEVYQYLIILETGREGGLVNSEEIKKSAFAKATTGRCRNKEIKMELDKLVQIGKISEKDNFYFLSGRQEIVDTKKERHTESLRKIKRAQKMASFLSVLPFIKMVAVCNVLGYLNAKREDDIDLFIITSSNKIWLARWWSAGFAKLLRLRPRPKKISDKFCFSFYISENHLNLEDISLNKDDIYFYYWMTQLIPLYDQGGYFKKFVEANKWVREKLPNAMQNYINEYKIKPVASIVKMIWEKTSLDFDNKLAKKLQMLWMPRRIKELINQNQGVIISDDILKFHLKDSRRELSEKWCDKISNFQ